MSQRIGVSGMTCGHCVSAVTEELSALPGVQTVAVSLVPGGTSVVEITSEEPVPASAIADAVAEAGYDVVPADAAAPQGGS